MSKAFLYLAGALVQTLERHGNAANNGDGLSVAMDSSLAPSLMPTNIDGQSLVQAAATGETTTKRQTSLVHTEATEKSPSAEEKPSRDGNKCIGLRDKAAAFVEDFTCDNKDSLFQISQFFIGFIERKIVELNEKQQEIYEQLLKPTVGGATLAEMFMRLATADSLTWTIPWRAIAMKREIIEFIIIHPELKIRSFAEFRTRYEEFLKSERGQIEKFGGFAKLTKVGRKLESFSVGGIEKTLAAYKFPGMKRGGVFRRSVCHAIRDKEGMTYKAAIKLMEDDPILVSSILTKLNSSLMDVQGDDVPDGEIQTLALLRQIEVEIIRMRKTNKGQDWATVELLNRAIRKAVSKFGNPTIETVMKAISIAAEEFESIDGISKDNLKTACTDIISDEVQTWVTTQAQKEDKTQSTTSLNRSATKTAAVQGSL